MIMAAAAVLKDNQLSKFLKTREVMKEEIRRRNFGHSCSTPAAEPQIKKEQSKAGGEQVIKKASCYTGSFFGPSLPTIAPRLFRETNSHVDAVKKEPPPPPPGVVKRKSKAETVRESRDYSFLTAAAPPPSTEKQSAKAAPAAVINTSVPKKRKIDHIHQAVPVPNPKTVKPNPKSGTPKLAGSAGGKEKLGRKMVKVIEVPPGKAKKEAAETVKIAQKKCINPAAAGKVVMRQKAAVVVRRKEEEEEEDEKALSMIRRMFRTERFAGRDDRDLGAMESTFEDIGKEERKSAKLARKEDAEQLRLLLLEEQQNKKKRRPNGD